nr:pentatricopeptide repeat-containing protein At1g71420 [Tanacetum cinerariifolium]
MRHLHPSNHNAQPPSLPLHHHFHQTLTHHLKNYNQTTALTLFYNNPNTPKTHQTYADIFYACARLNSISDCLKLHHHMIITHQQNQIKPTLYISNHIINKYAKCGFLENDRKVFDEIPERNIVTWSVLVSGYCQFGYFEEGFRLFCEMVKILRPNEFVYASVLSCCGLDAGRQVHAHAMKTCFDEFTYVGNALVKMYSSGEGVREAWRVFECLEVRNIVAWNSMVAAFQSGGKWEDGLRLFTLMRRAWDIGLDPSASSPPEPGPDIEPSLLAASITISSSDSGMASFACTSASKIYSSKSTGVSRVDLPCLRS